MPATIIRSEVAIYSDQACTTQVGSTITTNSAATAIAVGYDSLGVSLSAGTNYWAKARCTNSEQYTSDWTSAYNFKTLINVSFDSGTLSGTTLSILSSAFYGSAVSVQTIGYYYSTSADGSNAVTVTCQDQQDWERYDLVLPAENTTYYIVPFVIDNLNREYHTPWTSAESVTTGYNPAVLSVTTAGTTYNSITISETVTSSSAVSAVSVTIQAQGGTAYTKTLTAQAGTQTVTFTNGETLTGGVTVVINPSTTYTVTLSATNQAGTRTATTTATTAAQQISAIEISSVTDITPNSAVVNLSFS